MSPEAILDYLQTASPAAFAAVVYSALAFLWGSVRAACRLAQGVAAGGSALLAWLARPSRTQLLEEKVNVILSRLDGGRSSRTGKATFIDLEPGPGPPP